MCANQLVNIKPPSSQPYTSYNHIHMYTEDTLILTD